MTRVRLHHPLTGFTVVAAATLVYGVMFFLFYPLIGAAVCALVALPVIAAGWCFGLRVGLVAGLLAFPLHVLLLNLMGAPGIEVMFRGGFVGSTMVVLVGAVVGRLHDVGAALQASEQRYRLISELVSDFAFSVGVEADGTFKVEWATGPYERILGYTLEEMNADLLALTHPEDRAAVRSEIQQVFEGRSVSGEQRLITKSGEVRWVHIYRRPMWDAEHKRVLGFYGGVQDITERKQAQENLRISETRYRTLIETMNEGVIQVDTHDVVQFVNDQYCALTGYECEELLGKVASDILLDEANQEIVQEKMGLRRQGVSDQYELRVRRKSGETIWLHISGAPVKDASGAVIGSVGLHTDITERKRMELALQKSEERYRLISELVSDYAFSIVVGADGTLAYEWVTEFFPRVTGYTMDEINADAYVLIHPEDRAAVRAQVDQVLQGRSVGGESRIITKNGEVRWVHIYRRPMWDAVQKRVAHYYGVIQDITERKQAEEALRRQNEYLTALNETTVALMNRLNLEDLLAAIVARSGALVGTPHGCIYLVSPDKSELVLTISTPYARELIGKRSTYARGLAGEVWETGQTRVIDDYATWSDRTVDARLDVLHASIGIPVRSGDEFIGVLCLNYLEEGRKFSEDDVALLSRFAELASIALDNARLYTLAQQELAERRRAEDELRQLNLELEVRVRERTAELRHERTLLQAILDSMGEGLLYIEDNHIRYVNNALASLAGYEIGELIGQINTILMSDRRAEEEARIFRGEVLEPGTIWRDTTQFQRKDGSEFDAALTITVIAEDEVRGVVAIVRDVTIEKQLQAQKARFIANASHELRTPITNFKTRLYLLSRMPEQLETHLAILERVADQMTNLVEDLLDMSRFERGVVSLQCQEVILQTLINEAVELQQPEAARKNITLVTDLPGDSLHIFVDPRRIMQVLINLITNGVNYTPENGHVSVELRLEAGVQTAYAVICVRDTGIGIAPEHLPRLTEPFFRANEGSVRGTGLGLSITKEIIELHRGSILVDSKLGEGSTFCVRLPLKQALTP